jgi:hypothetical protein
MTEKKIKIQLTPLTSVEVKQKKIALTNLWKLKDQEGHVIGPFETSTLQDYISTHAQELEQLLAVNLSNDSWSPVFSYSVFQRRSQSKSTNENHTDSGTFYILLNGQKSGPYTKDDLQNLLAEGTIFAETQISTDYAKTWFKLYEHNLFNRRARKTNQELPFVPATEIIENNNLSKDEILKNRQNEDAIYQLADLGQNNTHEPQEEQVEQAEPDVRKKSRFMTASVAAVVLCVFAFTGMFFLNNMSGSSQEAKVTKTKTKSIDNSSRAVKRNAASVKKQAKHIRRKPASRVKAKKYKPRAPRKRVNNTRNKESIAKVIQDAEELDINDPEIQEEITKQLAGEYELDGEEDEGLEDEYFEEDRNDGYNGNENPVDHNAEDY